MVEYIGLGITLLVALAGLVTALKALKSSDSEAAKNYAEAALKVVADNKRLRELVEGLESEISKFKKLVDTLEEELDKLRKENQMLTEVNMGLRLKLKDFIAFQEFLDAKNASKE